MKRIFVILSILLAILISHCQSPNLLAAAYETDLYLQRIAETIKTGSKADALQALQDLIAYQSVTPTFAGVKLLFSLYDQPHNSIYPALDRRGWIHPEIEKSIPLIKINDDIIQWFESDAAISPNLQLRLLALRIIGANLSKEYPKEIQSRFFRLLYKFVFDPEEQIRIENIKYIVQVDSVEIIPLLSAALSDGSYIIRKTCLEGLKEYLDSPAVIDKLLQRFPKESSLTQQFDIEEALVSAVDKSTDGPAHRGKNTSNGITSTLLSVIQSGHLAVRSLAGRIIGRSQFIKNSNPEEKDKYIKALCDIQKDDVDHIIGSRVWSLRELCNGKMTPIMEETLSRIVFGSRVQTLPTKLLALDCYYKFAAPDQKLKLIKQIFPETFVGANDKAPILGTIDWRIQSYLYSLIDKEISNLSDAGLSNGGARELKKTLIAYRDKLGQSSASVSQHLFLKSRFEPAKTETLLKYGGDKETENAVNLGLEWLIRAQEPDGSWNCVNFNPWHNYSPLPLPSFTNEDELIDVSVTGLSLLCFLGSGSTHQYGPYQQSIAKGLKYIMNAQDATTGVINIPKGHIHDERCLRQGVDHGKLPRRYNHNISTLVLVETYAMSGDENIKNAAQRALEYSRNTPEPGYPWSFPLEPTDVAPGIFYILALKIAQQTDLIVSVADIEKVRVYLDRLTDKISGRIIHLCPVAICFGGMDSTATGLFAHLLMDASKENAMSLKVADWLKNYPPDWVPFYQFYGFYPNLLYLENNIINEWQWYYQTLAFKEIGGDYWRDWNKAYKRLLIRHQLKSGVMEGSWDPEGPWATIGGRIYSTTFGILSLQSYYSYSFSAPIK